MVERSILGLFQGFRYNRCNRFEVFATNNRPVLAWPCQPRLWWRPPLPWPGRFLPCSQLRPARRYLARACKPDLVGRRGIQLGRSPESLSPMGSQWWVTSGHSNMPTMTVGDDLTLNKSRSSPRYRGENVAMNETIQTTSRIAASMLSCTSISNSI